MRARLDSSQLHQWVDQYNWDDGLSPIWVIADSNETEFATALLIYWRLDGPWLTNSSVVNDEAVRLQSLVKDRLLSGFYSRGNSVFDPRSELSNVQIFKLRKAGLPPLLLGEVNTA